MAFVTLVNSSIFYLYSTIDKSARALYKHLQWRYHGIPWPSILLNPVDLISHFVKRMNEASVSDLHKIYLHAC